MKICGKKQNVAHYGNTSGKGNNISKSVKVKICHKNQITYVKHKMQLQRNESDTTCPLCKTEEDTKEHIMVCQEGNNTCNLLNANEKGWEKAVAIYKNNKENREKLEQQKSTKGNDIQQKFEII